MYSSYNAQHNSSSGYFQDTGQNMNNYLQAISVADHDVLYQARNIAYMSLDRKCIQLEAELAAEKRLNERLLSQISNAQVLPVASVNTSSANSQAVISSLETPPSIPFFEHDDHPKANRGIKVPTLDLLTDGQGVKLNTQALKSISQTFMAAMNQIHHHRLAPPNSTNLAVESRRYLTNTLLSAHEEFRYAEDAWKVRRYIIHKYPDWNAKDKTRLTRANPSIDNASKRKGFEISRIERSKKRKKTAPPPGTTFINLDIDDLSSSSTTTINASSNSSPPPSTTTVNAPSNSSPPLSTTTNTPDECPPSSSSTTVNAPSNSSPPLSTTTNTPDECPLSSSTTTINAPSNGSPPLSTTTVNTSINGAVSAISSPVTVTPHETAVVSTQIRDTRRRGNPLTGLNIPSTIAPLHSDPSLSTPASASAPPMTGIQQKLASVSTTTFSARNMFLETYLADPSNPRLSTNEFKLLWDKKKNDKELVKKYTDIGKKRKAASGTRTKEPTDG
ncbi:hypothetical protein F5051DRAFT_441243 [Lentinula edodes]|nr:hypothetical protein F5051DRAFT_441243 [Lentinula edodes]